MISITALKTFAVGKSPFLAAFVAMIIGAGAVGTHMAEWVNPTIIVALSGATGAFFASLPKIMKERTAGRVANAAMLEKEMALLIMNLKRSANQNERILDLNVALRHAVQDSYQATVWHVDLLNRMLIEKGTANIPKLPVLNVGAMIKQLDEEIKAIKAEDAELIQ